MNPKLVLSRIFPRYSRSLDLINYNALLAGWIREHSPIRSFDVSRDLFVYLNDEILDGGAIDFLEFGVYTGGSLRFWTRFNQHPDSRFFGFDSFEGLPEDWHLGFGKLPKGHFSTGGELPDVADDRVSFVKGWFQDTLGDFLASYTPDNRLVVHIDCDLYSSAMYCLTRLDPWCRGGTILLFDDFSGPLDVFRSFHDYVRVCNRRYRVIAARHPYYKEVAVELLGRE